MARTIHCNGCGAYLGEIRDARLRKDMVCYCQLCATERESRPQANPYSGPMGELFRKAFGGGRG